MTIFAGTASFVSNNHYYTVYAATKNATSSSSSSTSKTKGGSGSTNSATQPPIGSSTFLNVVTKVDNSKGGTKKPSDFTLSVTGNSPSPKSFSGSASGTSVTLKAGKYKVTGSGSTDYTTKYSSGCSGTATGGVPIKCTVSISFSPRSSGGGTSIFTGKSKQDTGKSGVGGFILTVRNCVQPEKFMWNCEAIAPPELTGFARCVANPFGPTCSIDSPSGDKLFACRMPKVGPGPQDIQCNHIG